MPARGQSYLLKNTTKARVKIGVQGGRAQLAYKDLTRAAAQGENTKIQRGIRQAAAGIHTDGHALKEGVLAMADRLGADTGQYNTIAAMDEKVLASMYESNDLTFEVFFNYEGVRKTDHGYIISDEKRRDIDWFINEYQRVAGMSGDREAFINMFANETI